MKSIKNLKQRWDKLKQNQPELRIRDAAKILNVSEAALLITGINQNVIRLKTPWDRLLKRFSELGNVMSLTRNEGCVLEHKGSFQEIRILKGNSHFMGTVIGSIETRVFFHYWGFAFAHEGEKNRKSIQIFDKYGDAITKIYLQPKSNKKAYNQIIDDFRDPEQSAHLDLINPENKKYNRKINKKEFLNNWSKLKDTHDFFNLINKYKLARHYSFELANNVYTFQTSLESVEIILNRAAQIQLPIMIFVANRGNLQIHQGLVKKIVPLTLKGKKWINILDQNFNLHLLSNLIATAWIVKKPTADGIVTSVEFFDANKNLIVQFFGLRKPGKPELKAWTNLTNDLI
tara:strand:+ start:1194 stop:2228 length:1035 start_codon:yes stop_codon:yes gene_type:complete